MTRIGSTVASLATLLAASGAAKAAEPSRLRLFHSDAACHEKPCADWRAVDQGGGAGFDAVADLTPLHLAPRLRTQALRGQIDLLVNATVSHMTVGGREITRVTVHRLIGVEPHSAVIPAAEPAPAAPDASAPDTVPAAAPPINANAPPAPPMNVPATSAAPEPSQGGTTPVPAMPPTAAAPTTPPEAVAPPAEPQAAEPQAAEPQAAEPQKQ